MEGLENFLRIPRHTPFFEDHQKLLYTDNIKSSHIMIDINIKHQPHPTERKKAGMKRFKALKRDHVNRVLESIFDYPLTIVEAPMGKPLRSWNSSQARAVPLCGSPFLRPRIRLLSFGTGSQPRFGKLDRETGDRSGNLGFPADAPQTAHILSLLGDMDFDGNTVLVLDDFHLAKDPKISALLKQIVKLQLDNLHIALITRDTTNLDITEPVAKRLRNIIPQHALRFTEDEIAQYCADGF